MSDLEDLKHNREQNTEGGEDKTIQMKSLRQRGRKRERESERTSL